MSLKRMIHQHHLFEEITYKVWVSRDSALKRIDKALSTTKKHRKIREKLGSGCHEFTICYPPYCFLVPGINDKENKIITTFFYCPTMSQEALSRVSDLMESYGGEELKAEEIKSLILLFSNSFFLGNEYADSKELMFYLLLLKHGSLGK